MKIGIDISQLAFRNTGVAIYLQNLVSKLLEADQINEYVLFFSSMRGVFPKAAMSLTKNPNVTLKTFKFPPLFFDIAWNRLHILPIEIFIGDVDIFITSDWAEPPSRRAKKITVLYDLIVLRYPEETHNRTSLALRNFRLIPNIVDTQKRRLAWVKKESLAIICISEATKKDALALLGIEKTRMKVIYPGI